MTDAITNQYLPVFWHQFQWRLLTKAFCDEKLAHALLLTGQAGLKKREFAQLFSRFLLCESSEKTEHFCGQCSSCDLFQAGSHPDYCEIAAESAGKAIKIDQIREIYPFLTTSSHRQQGRIVVIHDADQLTLYAANALLKMLEEPVANCYLLLISNYPSLLSATIRSRLQKIKFKYPDLAEELNATNKLEYATKSFPNEGDTTLEQTLLSDLIAIFDEAVSFFDIASSWQTFEFISVIDAWISCLSKQLNEYIRSNSSQLVVRIVEKYSLKNNINSMRVISYLYDFIDKLVSIKKIVLTSSSMNKQLVLEDLLITWSRLIKTDINTNLLTPI